MSNPIGHASCELNPSSYIHILDERENYAKLVGSIETAHETQLLDIHHHHADTRNLPKSEMFEEVSSQRAIRGQKRALPRV
jgi:hypothetical protein